VTSLHEPASGLDHLPPDQHAVLQMVLGRGHSYDEIAALLSIDRAAVRQRALVALDALGPATPISAQRRALITDYLLGQLPPRVSEEVRDHLARSASERTWARAVARELTPLSSDALSEVPSGAFDLEDAEDTFATDTDAAAALPAQERPPADEPAPRRVSRLGGAILLGAVAAAVIAAILIFAVFGVGGATSHKATAGKPASTKPQTGARPLTQINLTSPTKSKAIGIAEVIKAGSATGVVLVAQNLKPNSGGNAYAIWLYNSPTSALRLGYVRASSGRFQTWGRLPANAGSFRRIVVTLQSGPSNKPGEIVLQGKLSGV